MSEAFSSGYSLLVKGGLMMWPLIIASIAALAVAVERLSIVRGVLSGADELVENVTRKAQNGRVDEARAMALRAGGSVGRVLASGLDSWQRSSADCERAMFERAMIEREDLTRRLGILDTVITIAPLLGLLGTVTGMIKAFDVVGKSGSGAAQTAIMGGVAEALIATATGLGIAITALVFYNYLTEKVRQVVGLMEIAGTRLVNIHSRETEDGNEGHNATRAVSA